MKKIENLVVHGASTPTTMNIGVNRQFRKQRQEHPEYDQYLIELGKLLRNVDLELAKRIYQIICYNGTCSDIVANIIPHINDIYNQGYTPKGCMDMLFDGTWRQFDYATVYEHIEFENAKAYRKFIERYLNLLSNEDHIHLNKVNYFSCSINNGNTLTDFNDILNALPMAKHIVLHTAIRIPYPTYDLGVGYWNSLNLNTPEFTYRSAMVYKGKIQMYENQLKIVKPKNKACITESKWWSPNFYICSDENVPSDVLDKIEELTDKYNLDFGVEFHSEKIAGGVLVLEDTKLFEFKQDLAELVFMDSSIYFEGLLTGYSKENYMNEILQFFIRDKKVGIQVLSMEKN